MNINDYVWVKLTPFGEARFRQHYRALGIVSGEPKELVFDTDTGNWRFQLWELMHIFGPEMRMDAAQVFVGNEIKFEQPALIPQEAS